VKIQRIQSLRNIDPFLLVLFILGAIGLGVWIHFAAPDGFPSVDGVFYLEQSRALVLHNQLPFSTFPPGWPFLVSLPLFFGDPTYSQLLFRMAQGLNVVLGVCWPVLAFFLLRRNLGSWWAVLGAIILMGLPLGIIASKGDLSDLSFGCLLLLVFLLLPRRLFLAGLVLGYAYLVRPEALLVALGVIVWLAMKDRKIPWKTGLGMGLFILPYVLFIHHHTGTWALSGKMGFLESALQVHQGGELGGLVLKNLKTFLPMLPQHLGYPLFLLALAGLWLRPGFQYLAFLGLLPLPFFDFGMAARYWLPYLPFVILAAGWGMTGLVKLVRFVPGKALSAVLLILIVGGGLKASVDYFPWVPTNPSRYHGLRDSGLWLRSVVTENTKIASYKPFASFWAGAKFVKYSRCESPREMLDKLEAEGVEFLVVNAHVADVFIPNLRVLLSRTIDPEIKRRVEPLKVFQYNVMEQFTVVYRLKSQADVNQ